ncbi:MAG: HXXEE domain-containing protein [Candidatus Angelobacter sp.]
MPPQIDRRSGFAWLGFGVAIAIHVLDEATHDFLAFYNPNARTIRERLPFLPLPTFTFRTWLLTLAVGIAIFLCLSPFAFRGVRRARVAAIVVAFLVGIGNAGLHILSSIYHHRWMPGVYISPLLLLAAIFLIVTARSRPGAAANAAATH